MRLFLSGMFFSSTGVWIQRIAQDWLVLELTDSPTQVGITTMMQYLPMLFFGLFGGLAADRYSKRQILVCTQIAMMILSLVLAGLTLSGVVRPWQVFIVAFLVGTVFAFDIPARQSIVNELVAVHQLRTAIGVTATAFQIGAMLGPAVSGVMIGLVGPGYSFATTAVLYLVPMLALARMRLPRPTRLPAQADGGRPMTQLREGLRYVASRPAILATTILVGTFGTFISNLPVTNAAFARLVFHSGPSGYGLLSTLGAVGAILGAVYASTRHKAPRLRSNLLAGAALAALYLLASVAPGFYGYAIVLVAIGAMTITFMTLCSTTIQIAADVRVRGRVLGLFNLVFIGGGAIGGPLIGAIDQYAGPRVGLLVSGLIPAVVTVLLAARLSRTLGVRMRVELSSGRRGVSVVGPISDLPGPMPVEVVATEIVRCASGGCTVTEKGD